MVEKISKIHDDINEIFLRFAFDYNTEITRKKICYLISQYLDREIIDQTSQEFVDQNKFCFMVNIDGQYYELMNYINNINIIERGLKLKKIKNKLKWKE